MLIKTVMRSVVFRVVVVKKLAWTIAVTCVMHSFLKISIACDINRFTFKSLFLLLYNVRHTVVKI